LNTPAEDRYGRIVADRPRARLGHSGGGHMPRGKNSAGKIAGILLTVVTVGLLVLIGLAGADPHAETPSRQEEKEQSTPQQREVAIRLITGRGYDCRFIDLMRPYIFGGGWVVSCNNRQYRFNLEDHGGKWTVEAQ
jgi:hypothetical protein